MNEIEECIREKKAQILKLRKEVETLLAAKGIISGVVLDQDLEDGDS